MANAANQYFWAAAADGNADDTSMWNTQTASNAAYIFDISGIYTVGLGADWTTSGLICFDDGEVALDLAPFTWTAGNKDLRIPYKSAGTGSPKVVLRSGTLGGVVTYVGHVANREPGELAVTGSGTTLNTAALTVGEKAPGAKMTISAGATVNASGVPTVGASADSGNAELYVLDGGTLSVASPNMTYVGTSGSCSNLLRIAGAGSSVTLSSSTQLRLGVDALAHDNRIEVTDGGTLTCGHNLIVGNLGTNNVCEVKNGGGCTAAKIYVGGGYTSCSNRLEVSGQGTTLKSNGALEIGMGGNYNLLKVFGGARVTANTIDFNMGTKSGASGNEPSFGNRFEATGAGTYVEAATSMSIGHTNGLARLAISDGAAVNVKGGSSKFSYLGELGETYSNSMEIVSGGIFTNSTKFVVGNPSTSYGNSILLSGAGSTLYQSAYLKVGNHGPCNSFTVEDGAFLNQRAALYIGDGSLATGNVMRVSGAATIVTNTAVLYLGNNGSCNTLSVREGVFHDNNIVYLGKAGAASSNRLEIADGAYFYANGIDMASASTGVGNVVAVDNATLYSNGEMLMANSSTLELAGSMPDDRSGEYVHIPRLTLNDGTCTLKFTGDRNGMPFLYNRKTGGVTSNIKIVAASGGSIEVDASKCRVAGTYKLIDSPNVIPDALLENITASANATVYASADKKILYVDVAASKGTIMLMR